MGFPTASDAKPDTSAARACGRRQDALIEILHRLQERKGHLAPEVLAAVARELALPPSRVLGVASFYHLFRLAPPAPHRCVVCLGTACFVRGGPALMAVLERRLGCRAGGPPGAAGWALAAGDCLGACGLAPLVMADGQLLRDLPLADGEALASRFTAAGLP
ncbi:MAG: NAD(P)H-dependent oxidoreductase subunit E [Cyanobacteriota bacterium]|nr:NAD(P)H-dependent oxidoreductase subunit E [Cyanobacteriota bacterium]